MIDFSLKRWTLYALFLGNIVSYLSLLYLTFDDMTKMSNYTVRENLRAAKKEFAKTEDDLKSLQSVGQIIGEVLRPLDNERCKLLSLLILL